MNSSERGMWTRIHVMSPLLAHMITSHCTWLGSLKTSVGEYPHSVTSWGFQPPTITLESNLRAPTSNLEVHLLTECNVKTLYGIVAPCDRLASCGSAEWPGRLL